MAELPTEPRPRLPEPALEDVVVVALVKGGERYTFKYRERQRPQVLRMLGRFAADSELSFSWYDAATLSEKISHPTKGA